MAGTYYAGESVRIPVQFNVLNSDGTLGALVDPTTITLKYGIIVPSIPAVTTQTYNPGNIIRDGAGLYHFDLDTTGLDGELTWEWIATGAAATIAVGTMVINPLPL